MNRATSSTRIRIASPVTVKTGYIFGDGSLGIEFESERWATRGMTGVNYRRWDNVLAIPVNNHNRDISIFAARYIDSSVGLAAAD